MQSLWRRGGSSCRITFAWWWTNWSRRCQSSQLTPPKRLCWLCCLSVCEWTHAGVFDVATERMCECVYLCVDEEQMPLRREREQERCRAPAPQICVVGMCWILCFLLRKNTTVIETLNYSTRRSYRSCYMPVQRSLCYHTSKTNLHKHTSLGYIFSRLSELLW